MKKRSGCLYNLAVIAIVTLAIGAVVFYGGKFIDRYRRPWAYSETEPLLVGRWRGDYKDPDGIAKTLDLEIFLPETDDERWGNTFRRRRRHRSRRSHTSFTGKATVISRLGREEYEIWGHVHDDNYHQIDLTFSADEKKPLRVNNFHIHHAEQSHWQDDELTGTLLFVYRRPDNSSYSDSADPRYDKRVPVRLVRVRP